MNNFADRVRGRCLDDAEAEASHTGDRHRFATSSRREPNMVEPIKCEIDSAALTQR